MNGLIDDLRIYDFALSQAQVQMLYQGKVDIYNYYKNEGVVVGKDINSNAYITNLENAGGIRLATRNTDRMVITSSGDTNMYGTLSFIGASGINGTANVSSESGSLIFQNSSETANDGNIIFRTAGTDYSKNRMTIMGNGSNIVYRFPHTFGSPLVSYVGSSAFNNYISLSTQAGTWDLINPFITVYNRLSANFFNTAIKFQTTGGAVSGQNSHTEMLLDSGDGTNVCTYQLKFRGSDVIKIDNSTGTNVFNYTGNMGIGTLTPQAPLHVVGNSITMGGNVGIGLINPQYPLDVVGNVNITGSLTLSGAISSLGIISKSASMALYAGAYIWPNNNPNSITTARVGLESHGDYMNVTTTGLYSVYVKIRFSGSGTIRIRVNYNTSSLNNSGGNTLWETNDTDCSKRQYISFIQYFNSGDYISVIMEPISVGIANAGLDIPDNFFRITKIS